MDCRHIQFQIHDPYGSQTAGELRPLELYQLRRLFEVSAFWAKDRRMEDMAVAIANSRPVVTVWDGEQLIGFARATSDGVYRATIWDVVIHPTYQGEGLGRKLVETVLMHPHVRNAERVYLMTTHQQEFYKCIGFEENSTTTMVLFNSKVDGLSVTQKSVDYVDDRRFA
ncbi:MAG: GNAT family N-acetyltransferase [Cyanobacteria bacterium P01_F01_bin.150]